MRKIITLVCILLSNLANSQYKAENIIIITTDGFRWQEIFKGMDSAIANNSKFNEGDSSYIFEKYWSGDEKERRKKLMPFLWDKIAKDGQVYGNRVIDNKMDNMNPHWFSYPGYSEIMTGYVDTTIDRNDYPPNPYVTVLEFLNKQTKFKGKVAAFGAWDAFDRILNEKRSGIPVISAFDKLGGKAPTANERMMNTLLKDVYRPWHEGECLDVFTHYAAWEQLRVRKPRILYIAYGETDEWAHAGKYRSYLDAAHQVDAWIKQLWEYLQTDPQYRNKTAVLFTTDHGRGDINKEEWTSHNKDIQDSHEIWLAAMGTGIPPRGEIKTSQQLYQQQIAQTIAKILGYTFKANHPVAEEIKELFRPVK